MREFKLKDGTEIRITLQVYVTKRTRSYLYICNINKNNLEFLGFGNSQKTAFKKARLRLRFFENPGLEKAHEKLGILSKMSELEELWCLMRKFKKGV